MKQWPIGYGDRGSREFYRPEKTYPATTSMPTVCWPTEHSLFNGCNLVSVLRNVVHIVIVKLAWRLLMTRRLPRGGYCSRASETIMMTWTGRCMSGVCQGNVECATSYNLCLHCNGWEKRGPDPSLTDLPFYPSALRAGGVLSSRSGRAGGRLGGRLPNLRNPSLGNRLKDFLNSKLCWIV